MEFEVSIGSISFDVGIKNKITSNVFDLGTEIS